MIYSCVLIQSHTKLDQPPHAYGLLGNPHVHLHVINLLHSDVFLQPRSFNAISKCEPDTENSVQIYPSLRFGDRTPPVLYHLVSFGSIFRYISIIPFIEPWVFVVSVSHCGCRCVDFPLHSSSWMSELPEQGPSPWRKLWKCWSWNHCILGNTLTSVFHSVSIYFAMVLWMMPWVYSKVLMLRWTIPSISCTKRLWQPFLMQSFYWPYQMQRAGLTITWRSRILFIQRKIRLFWTKWLAYCLPNAQRIDTGAATLRTPPEKTGIFACKTIIATTSVCKKLFHPSAC